MKENTTNQEIWNQKHAHGVFVFEEQGEHKHFPGAHWEPFFEQDEAFLDYLESKLSESMPKPVRNALERYRYFPYRSDSPFPDAEYLCYPDSREGICYIDIEPDAEEIHLASLFPLVDLGSEIMVTLQEKSVKVWSSKVEAQIEASLGSASIAFYDTGFVHAWPLYCRVSHVFRLLGIAYTAFRPDNTRVEINLEKANPAVRSALQQEPGQMTGIFDLMGWAMLFPIKDWDIDEYSYGGIIKKVTEVSTFGIPGWVCSVCVVRDFQDDGNVEEILLDILVTHNVWKYRTVPTVGDPIQGRLWLQGEMLRPYHEENEKA